MAYEMEVTACVPSPNRISVTLYVNHDPYTFDLDGPTKGWTAANLGKALSRAGAAFAAAIKTISAVSEASREAKRAAEVLEQTGIRAGARSCLDFSLCEDD